MKRLMAAVIAVMMIISCVSVLAEGTDPAAPVYDYHQLTVGSTTGVNGNFFSGMFGNNTADMDIQLLLHGYDLVEWNTELGGFDVNNSVVSGISVTENEIGDRTYTLALYQDMYFSDGTQITARDYAFSILLNASPEMAEIGASVSGAQCIAGMSAYLNGASDVLTGIRVVNDFMLAVTVSHEYRPFFYELGLLNYYPYPVSVIAPGCSVRDDGNGIYLDNREAFTADLLRQTVLDPETGYLSHPSVVSGPYKLVSFDGQNVTLEINPYFKGDSKGNLPQIERIIYQGASNDNMIEELGAANVGLLNKVVSAASIEKGLELISGGYYSMTNYTRSGLSYVTFCCEKDTVKSTAVRQAIASCMDKDNLVQDYTGYYGLRVDGYYGMGQWMYQVISGTLAAPEEVPGEDATAAEIAAYEEKMKQWEELSMDEIPVYAFDPSHAEELLIADGWTLNTAGGSFNKETDSVRCKNVDGSLIVLDLKLVIPAGNTIRSALEERFINNLQPVGIRVTIEEMPMNELLNIFYRQTERDVDMIFLATNFRTVFDPSLTYSTDDAAQCVYNTSGIKDEELFELAVDMRKTEPGDLYTYCEKWIEFQKRWVEVLPAIPVYSNVYFDFYTANLQDYNIAENISWAQAVVGACMGDIRQPEEEEEGGEVFEEEGTEEVFEFLD